MEPGIAIGYCGSTSRPWHLGIPPDPGSVGQTDPVIDHLDLQLVKLSSLISTVHDNPEIGRASVGEVNGSGSNSGALISVPVANIMRFRDDLVDVE